MANMSNYLEEKIIKLLFKNEALTAPTNIYVALCTAEPTEEQVGGNIPEVSGGGYTRKPVATGANWSAPVGGNGTTKNQLEVKWENVQWAAQIVGVALCDAASAGNVLFYGALAATKDIAVGDSVTFPIDSIVVQLD